MAKKRIIFTPPDFIVGLVPEPLLRYLRDNIFNIIGKVENWHEIGGGSGEPAFENSWANVGGAYETAGFYKDPYGRVYLKGNIDTGTGATTAFTLPAGYRPAASLRFQVGDSASEFVIITAAGLVQPAVNTDIYLDGIAFRSEQ